MSTGDLVGFVNLGNPEINFSTFVDATRLESHVMVFYIQSIAKNFRFSFAYFGTNGMNAYQIMTMIWDAVSILELTCKLPVIWEYMDDELSEVVYRTINLFAEDPRYLFLC